MMPAVQIPRVPARELRCRAFALMKKCLPVLLIASMLIFLLGFLELIPTYFGAKVEREVYQREMAPFYEEYPQPSAEELESLDTWTASLFLSVGEESAAERPSDDLINWDLKEYVAKSRALDAAKTARIGWDAVSSLTEIVSAVISFLLLLGLYRGLLDAVRGGKLSLRCLTSWKDRTGTALWLYIQCGLRTVGWILLACIPVLLLAFLVALFEVEPAFVFFPIMLPAALLLDLRYLLPDLYLADADAHAYTARDCIEQGVSAMGTLGYRYMLRVLWPTYLALLPGLLVSFLPDPPVWAAVVIVAAEAVLSVWATSFRAAAAVCAYEEVPVLRQTQEELRSEGLERARALASAPEKEDAP